MRVSLLITFCKMRKIVFTCESNIHGICWNLVAVRATEEKAPYPYAVRASEECPTAHVEWRCCTQTLRVQQRTLWGDRTDRHSTCSAPREEQAERATQRDAELEKRYMTAEKLESPLDPLLAALANFHSSADLSAKVAACLMRACFVRIKAIAGVSLCADPRAVSPHRRQRQRLRRLQGLHPHPAKYWALWVSRTADRRETWTATECSSLVCFGRANTCPCSRWKVPDIRRNCDAGSRRWRGRRCGCRWRTWTR